MVQQITRVEEVLIRYFNFLGQENSVVRLDVSLLTSACEKMASEKTGAIIVIERSNSLDFLTNTGDKTNISLSSQILETIFFKNSPLHDGAIIIKDNTITATRVVLPVSESTTIPKRYGLTTQSRSWNLGKNRCCSHSSL